MENKCIVHLCIVRQDHTSSVLRGRFHLRDGLDGRCVGDCFPAYIYIYTRIRPCFFSSEPSAGNSVTHKSWFMIMPMNLG